MRLLLIFFVFPASHLSWATSGINYPAHDQGLLLSACHWPAIFLSHILHSWASPETIINATIGLELIFADLCIVFLLIKILSGFNEIKSHSIWFFYWCSPIVIYLNYWHGSMMVFSVTLFLAALWFLFKRGAPCKSALALLASLLTSFDSLLAIPFVFICLFRHRGLKQYTKAFSITFFFGLIGLATLCYGNQAWFFPYLMQWQSHLANLASLQLLDAQPIYLFPFIYMIYAYALWRLRRISVSMLSGLLGIGFIFVGIISAAQVSWFMWAMPFLVLHQVRHCSDEENIIILLFSFVFIAIQIAFQTTPLIPALSITATTAFAANDTFLQPFLFMLSDMGWFVIALSLFVKGIRKNPDYRLTGKPLTIGIAGGSGTGKDTLSAALAGLFEPNTVSHISGDDYHLWDRYSPMWKEITHLNPRANDLYRFSKDLLDLLKNKWVLTRRYNHHTGRFDQSYYSKQGDVILASGLHTLLVPELKNKFDVKVFLNMDENLRIYLKKQRDIHERGKSEEAVLASIARRQPDGKAYIAPQADEADVIFKLSAKNPDDLQGDKKPGPMPMELKVIIKQASYYQELARFLTSHCGLSVDVAFKAKDHTVELTINGELNDADILSGAKKFLPEFQEWLSKKPRWYGGMRGLMQLIVILHASEILYARDA